MFQQKYLAHNIKKYRRLRGMTQGELAEKLFVTAQNVSKWETGKSVPDLEKLCRLAEIFAVSPDRLLGGGQEAPREEYLVAVDGGGTKTEFLLFTREGRVCQRLLLGRSNPNAVGMEGTQGVLRQGLDRLLSVQPNISAVYAGIAGCGLKSHAQKILSLLKKTYPMLRFAVDSDVPNVIYSAPVEEKCIAVICGTGSVVFAKTRETMHRLGGWGYLWESGCSGYDFGRDALHASLAAAEDMGPATALRALTEKHLGGDIREKLGEIYRLGQDGIAAFAGTVFEAWEAGDAVAEEILEKNAWQLAKLINTAARRYDCGSTVVMAGGLLAQKKVLEHFLSDKLDPGLTLFFNPTPQICGAAVGSCRLLGEVAPEFKTVLYRNYLRFMEEENHAENGNA